VALLFLINVRVSTLDDHTWFVPWEPMVEEYARLGARP
jgi:hypothetical protein